MRNVACPEQLAYFASFLALTTKLDDKTDYKQSAKQRPALEGRHDKESVQNKGIQS